ncbi:unnamed protein product [Nippostrongylus brasiliensis]|uniref:Nephrocystin-1-like protein (inferred by orthology to a C. elegans protein) n=1 Tax=Nippostrongylus brasiliensis TaxID=27835 RepID=A0A158QYT2_NIPBR|nr:unnamed protein product [Nippostrongylus brasiliensis]
MKNVQSTEVQRMTALGQLEDLQERLLRVAPERDRTSSEGTSLSRGGDDSGRSFDKVTRERSPATQEPITLAVSQETPVMVHTPQPEAPAPSGRRASLMYDAASDEEDGGGEVEEQQLPAITEEREDSSTSSSQRPQQSFLPPGTEKRATLPPVQPQSAPQATVRSSSGQERSGPKGTQRPKGPPVGPPEQRQPPPAGLVVEGNVFVALASLRAAEPSDLNIVEGELLNVIQTRPDGWWTARNSKGDVGLVPKTYLRQATADDEARSAANTEAARRTEPRQSTGQRPPSPSQGLLAVSEQVGDAQEMDPHLSFACHLTPRLSHSNIGFHDLYWNYRDDKLRKRRVRVSKLVRLVRLEGMPRETGVCLIRTALYDRSRRTGRQIVSNVHAIRAEVKNRTWTFNTRTDTASSGVDYGDFVVRSNYNMADVVLLIEASHVVASQGGFEERSLGIITMDLIAKGEVTFSNKTYSESLRAENIFDRSSNGNSSATPHKIVLKVLDVPQELVALIDSMPDVLVFNPMFVRLYFFFRRYAGISLLRDRDNHLSAATSFLQLFMNTTFCVHKTAVMPPYRIWDSNALAARHQILKKCEDMLREHRSPSRFLLTEPCRPLNIYDYSFDLLGRHALD